MRGPLKEPYLQNHPLSLRTQIPFQFVFISSLSLGKPKPHSDSLSHPRFPPFSLSITEPPWIPIP